MTQLRRLTVVHEGRPELDAAADGLERVDIGHTDRDGHHDTDTDTNTHPHTKEVGSGVDAPSTGRCRRRCDGREVLLDTRCTLTQTACPSRVEGRALNCGVWHTIGDCAEYCR